jgi:cytochrome c-type biogenesis protein CcmE
MSETTIPGEAGVDDAARAAAPAGSGGNGRRGHDLTPREVRPIRRRRWLPIGLVVLVVLAIGALLFKTLGDATLFFKNANEAVAERDSLGDRRFQLQGTVVPGTIERSELDGKPAVAFSISFDGVALDVLHIGNPPELFKEGEAVVLEGHWTQGTSELGSFDHGVNDGWFFASDRMLAKHDAKYEADNPDRIKQATEGGQVPVTGNVGDQSSTQGAPQDATK